MTPPSHPQAEPLLEVVDLSVEFRSEDETVRAVDSLSFQIGRGEILGIVGESGSGKSVTGLSLLRLIPAPIGRIVGGQAFFRGQDLLSMPIERLRRIRGQEIGIIFQEPMTALSPLMTIGKQMVETLRLHEKDLSKEAARDRASHWLQRVGIPDAESRLDAYPFEFSGGMRQRAMIAMTLMLEPSLVIADEPTTALDVTIQRQIFELILAVKRSDSSLLFITHDMGVIWQLCDRVLVMEKARKVEEGPLREIFAVPREAYTRELLAAVPRLTDPPRSLSRQAERPKLIEIAGLKTWYPVRKGLLSRAVAHIKAVDGVSLDIRQGETLALVGESGSGKSTLGRSILGLERPCGGDIRFRGESIVGLPRRRFKPYRRRLQIVFQDPFSSLNPRLPALDILTEGMEEHGLLRGADKADVAERLLREVKLPPEHMRRYPHEFSGGQRQRLCIARALSLEPEFVILDEAVSALDVTIQAQIVDLLLEVQDRRALSFLFISHDLSVVKKIADRVVVMRAGRVEESGETEAVIGDPQRPYTRQLLAAVPVPGDERTRLTPR